jgi:F-type H+-transporting ATPase subunit a
MSPRFVPWIFLILAIVLAIVAVAVEFQPPPPGHEHNPFEHVADPDVPGEWVFLESQGWVVHLARIPKFAILEILAAILVLVIFFPIARRVATGQPPRGAWHNAFESILTFIRNDIAKPNLGEEEADRFVPFLWTLFLFILFCNLLGMIPWFGSPTANLYVTGALALVAFVMMHAAAIVKMGSEPAHGHHDHHGQDEGERVPVKYDHREETHGHVSPERFSGLRSIPVVGGLLAGIAFSAVAFVRGLVPYFKAMWPHIDVPFGLGYVLKPMIFVIEMFGTVIKSGVLAVRLFANMFAGHTVLAMILSFIITAANAVPLLWGSITFASVFGVVALSLLELFVAFLQTYIFVFLTALFMGMSLHPQH